jgi:hypothetical protein
VGKAVGEAGRCDSYAEDGEIAAGQAGSLRRLELTKPEPLGCRLRMRKPYAVDNASAGHAGCVPWIRPTAMRAEQCYGLPELEGELYKQGQRLANLKCARMMQIPAEKRQYVNMKTHR